MNRKSKKIREKKRRNFDREQRNKKKRSK